MRSYRRSFLGLVAGCAVVVALMPPATVGAAPAGTLFAIASTSQTLVKVDLITGSFTQVANLNVTTDPIPPQSINLVSDPVDHRLSMVRIRVTGFDPVFFFPIFKLELLTFDSRTGAQVFNPAPAFSRFAPSLAFDTSSKTLFGFTGLDVVKVDPATATLTKVASIATSFGPFINSIALDSSTHTFYVSQETAPFIGPSTTNLFAVNDQTGVVAAPVTLDQAVRQIGIDSGHLYGITECCPAKLVGINPASGATTLVSPIADSGTVVQFGTAADPSTHNVFINVSTPDPITFAITYKLLIVNDQTGKSTTLPLADGMPDNGLAFEAPPQITPQSIIDDVNAALASGAIDNAGVANSLLAKLDAAAAARATAGASGARTNACATAAHIYEAFIAEVTTLSAAPASGVRPHIDSAAASQLISEAKFLIANCP